jgi:DNA-directed RNA polymerase subunit RPC12/RpoP
MEKDILEKLRAFVVETEQDADASDFAVAMAVICEAAVDEITSLRQWVNDLQSGMYVSCVYCGHRYGPDDKVPGSMADALKQHIEQCPKHPMSQLRKQYVSLVAENLQLREERRWGGGCEGCEGRSSVERGKPYQCQYCSRNYGDKHDVITKERSTLIPTMRAPESPEIGE